MRHPILHSFVRPRPLAVIRQIKGDYARIGYGLFDLTSREQIGQYMNADLAMAMQVLGRRSRELGYATPHYEERSRRRSA